MIKGSRLFTAAVAVLISASALTACGSSSASSSTGDASTSAPAVVKQKASKASLTTPTIETSGQLTICTALSTGNPPTYFTDSENKPVGAEVEMAEWIAKDLGLDAKFVDVAFASIVPAVQAGKCDVIMSSLYIKPERAKVVDFTPYLMSGSAVAAPKGNPKNITGMDDSLCGLKVSAAVGKTATLLAQEQAKKCAADGKAKLTVVQTDQTTAAVQQLVSGQVDAYAGETPVVLYYQKKQANSFEMVGKPFGEIEVGAAVKKGNDELSKALSKSFATMNSDGAYQQILKRWAMTSLAYKF